MTSRAPIGSWRAAIRAAILLAAAMGCENPTAPKMLETIERTPLAPNEFLKRWWALDAWLNRADLGHNHDKPTPIAIIFDGQLQHYRAAVIERVYLPAPYDHGKPVSRRTLLIWNDSTASAMVGEFAPGRSELVSSISARVDMGAPEFLFGSRSTLSAMQDANARTWRSDAGVIDIADASTDEACSERMAEGDVNAHGRTVECARTRYRVTGEATMARLDTSFVGIAVSVVKRTASLTLGPVEIAGIRLTVQCPAKFEVRGAGDMCPQRFWFWRDAGQYAPSLGLDLAALRPCPDAYSSPPNGYCTDLAEGKGEKMGSGQGGLVSYVIRRPDGAEVERSLASVPRDSRDDPIGGIFGDGMRVGGRRRVLLFLPIPWRPPYTRPAAEPLIVDFEVRPEP